MVNPVYQMAQKVKLDCYETPENEIAFDLEEDGKNVTKIVDKLYDKLECLHEKLEDRFQEGKIKIEKDISMQAGLKLVGWDPKDDKYAKFAQWL